MAKIGVVISSLYACGGEERVVSLMANEWVKQHEVTIFTFEDRERERNRNDYPLSEKIKVERVFHSGDSFLRKVIRIVYFRTGLTEGTVCQYLLKKAFYPEKFLKEWIERINAGNYDLMIGISGVNTMLLGYIKDHIHAKAISWEHSSFEGYFDAQRGYYRNRMKMYRRAAEKLDGCVVLNQDIQGKYRDQLGISATVIYNPRSFASEQKADMAKKCFVTCGRVEAEKGYEDLLFAINEAKDHACQDWKLLIIGGGSLTGRLNEQIRELGLEDKVSITGYLHNVQEQLLKGSVFVLPSRWEGFPMSVTEALELGLPVVAYDLPAMLPLVRDGEEGRIVPCFDKKKFAMAMEELAGSDEMRRQMSEAAIRKAKELSPEKIAEQWEDLFSRLLR